MALAAWASPAGPATASPGGVAREPVHPPWLMPACPPGWWPCCCPQGTSVCASWSWSSSWQRRGLGQTSAGCTSEGQGLLCPQRGRDTPPDPAFPPPGTRRPEAASAPAQGLLQALPLLPGSSWGLQHTVPSSTPPDLPVDPTKAVGLQLPPPCLPPGAEAGGKGQPSGHKEKLRGHGRGHPAPTLPPGGKAVDYFINKDVTPSGGAGVGAPLPLPSGHAAALILRTRGGRL